MDTTLFVFGTCQFRIKGRLRKNYWWITRIQGISRRQRRWPPKTRKERVSQVFSWFLQMNVLWRYMINVLKYEWSRFTFSGIWEMIFWLSDPLGSEHTQQSFYKSVYKNDETRYRIRFFGKNVMHVLCQCICFLIRSIINTFRSCILYFFFSHFFSNLHYNFIVKVP